MPDDPATQERVFAFLSNTGTSMPVTRIDTHAASVFLRGTQALKVKHAIRFPFLDYSTLEKRRLACEDEIRINQGFAPQIYHRCVAITEQHDGTLQLDGTGRPIEYAVEMTRFDHTQTLDHVAGRGPLTAELSLRIADVIVAAHARAPRLTDFDWTSTIPTLIEHNATGLGDGGHLDHDAIDAFSAAARNAFAQLQPLLAQRDARGFARRCHGDLHLANIVLIDQQPLLFDAIEFDARIASIDVLYDLAFTLMDLLHHNQHPAASIIFNRYLATTSLRNLDALGALPLFMAIRAAIRAQVLLARPDSDPTAGIAQAASYFTLAQRLITPAPPRLIVIGGLSGTGKSVLANALAPHIAPQPGAVVLRSDVIRKQMFQHADNERLPAHAYQGGVTARVYDTLLQRARRILSHGHSVILDAVFARESERFAVADLARDCGVAVHTFFLSADLATRQTRIGSRTNDASDATAEIAALQEHFDLRTLSWTIIDASTTPDETLGRTLAAMA
ncbi:MAG: AAA family ATPase [Alphaproteobacteria bacterium]|nr:AAA family ATPase [Alphaproteobacteria bacterium]